MFFLSFLSKLRFLTHEWYLFLVEIRFVLCDIVELSYSSASTFLCVNNNGWTNTEEGIVYQYEVFNDTSVGEKTTHTSCSNCKTSHKHVETSRHLLTLSLNRVSISGLMLTVITDSEWFEPNNKLFAILAVTRNFQHVYARNYLSKNQSTASSLVCLYHNM